MDCNRCELRGSCVNVVWGKGPIGAKYMFIGEGPDFEDELMEEPFMSREGKLLRSLIERSQINLGDCYLTHAIKCKTDPKTRQKRKFIEQCSYWLLREIAQLRPRVIVSLGKVPTFFLLKLKSSDSLSLVVGQKKEVVSIDCPIYPWYSPAYLLQHGKKMDVTTVAFFTQLKDSVNEMVA